MEKVSVLNKKLNKKGFTLAELLVVVAIIAILVAVSIPIFTSRLNDARIATDKANVRAAKAAAVTEYLGDQDTKVEGNYNAETGKIQAGVPAAYGKSKDAKTGADGTPEDTYLHVVIEPDGTNAGEVQINWVN